MKFILAFSGSIGARLLPSSISAPEPLAHQWSALIPQPMNTAAKRFGKASRGGRAVAGGATCSAPQTGTDSSHGSAIATPAPRRKVRRDATPLGDGASA